MKNDLLDSVSDDLLSIPPLMFRGLWRKVLRTALSKAQSDISPLHFQIIKLLDEAGTLHVAEIGKRLQIARAQMTHLIDKLVELKIVERQSSESDRRTINIRLTDEGKSTFKARGRDIRRVIRGSLSDLTNGELEELSALLKKLQGILSKIQ